MRLGLRAGPIILVAMLVGAVAAQTPPPSAQPIADQLGPRLASLKDAIAAIEPDRLHLPKAQKRAIADGQAAIARNLSEAVPGLLSGFKAAPDDIGAAFKLYRDVAALLVVAERSGDAIATADDASATDTDALQTSTQHVEDSWNQLGDWIAAHGSTQYAELLAARQAAAQAATLAKPAPAPKTLVIGDANMPASTSPKKKPAAKKAAPTIPH